MATTTQRVSGEPVTGQMYTHRAVNDWIGGNWQRGIRYAGNFPDLNRVSVIMTNASPYHDDPSTDEIRYVGEGLRGDQHIHYGNRALTLMFLKRKPVYVFAQECVGTYEALGTHRIVDIRATIERDQSGAFRGAFIFTLRRI